ncbi:hypothetical protein DAPK24_006390 [Pichia kluyveri]|uniref:Kinetochore protein SPC25 n=1 Tax=Pichia kluyveri TaxID=36015 RepID=A0AAV5QXZ8_PICKL|nr:hypothetical protein DAPK24_006390 [Pichia kluyveri]
MNTQHGMDAFNSTAEAQVRNNIQSLKSLKPEMDNLKNSINEYIANVQNTILKNRASYQVKLSQLKSTEMQLKAEIESNKLLREQLYEELSNEMRNKDQSSIKVEEMKIQEENLEKEKLQLTKDLENIEIEIVNKTREINEQKDSLKNQTNLVNDKLYQFEQLLGLRIEPYSKTENEIENEDNTNQNDTDEIGVEKIKFIFKNVDPSDFAREVWFVFDPESVSIVSTYPEIPTETCDEIIKNFIHTKEIGLLWKQMRYSLQKKLLS